MSRVFGLSVALRLPAAYRTGTGLRRRGGLRDWGGMEEMSVGGKLSLVTRAECHQKKVLNANRLIHAMAKQC